MAEIDRRWATQLGLLVRDQTTEAGMSARTTARRLGTGTWERMHRNVFRLVAFDTTREQRLLAATLAAGAFSAVSHRAATAMWGVDRFDCDLVELTHPFGHGLRLNDGRALETAASDTLAEVVLAEAFLSSGFPATRLSPPNPPRR